MTTAIQDAGNTSSELSGDELIAECKARANVYRLLAGAFLEEPTVEYLNAIRSPEVMASLKDMGVAFDKDFTDAPIGKLQDELACEYAVLFIVAGGCPAVESVRLQGRYQQQPCFEVREIYQKAGFQLTGARFKVFDDQLGVELTFVAEMLERAAAALTAGDQEGYEGINKEIRRFWALHLGKWVRGYSMLLARATEYSFYREIAKLLGGFAQWELDLLGVKVDDLDGGKLKVPKAEIKYEYDPDEPECNACDSGQDDADDLEMLAKTIDISLIEKRLQEKK